MTNREKFTEIFGYEITQRDTGKAIPGHCKILITSDKYFNEWLKQEYVLSAQPREDIKAMCGECDAWNKYKNYPQPGWIPCSKQLPKKSGEYLVTIKGWKGKFTSIIGYNAECNEWINEKACRWTVLSWQPKPQPWEGE